MSITCLLHKHGKALGMDSGVPQHAALEARIFFPKPLWDSRMSRSRAASIKTILCRLGFYSTCFSPLWSPKENIKYFMKFDPSKSGSTATCAIVPRKGCTRSWEQFTGTTMRLLWTVCKMEHTTIAYFHKRLRLMTWSFRLKMFLGRFMLRPSIASIKAVLHRPGSFSSTFFSLWDVSKKTRKLAMSALLPSQNMIYQMDGLFLPKLLWTETWSAATVGITPILKIFFLEFLSPHPLLGVTKRLRSRFMWFCGIQTPHLAHCPPKQKGGAFMDFGVAGIKLLCIDLVFTLYLPIYSKTRKKPIDGSVDSAVLSN